MQILGKVWIAGKEKEILLKEENPFFCYYSLEKIGFYEPKTKMQKSIFEKGIPQIIGEIQVKNEPKEVLVKKEETVLGYYYLNLIGVYTPKIPGETIIFKQETLENKISDDIKDNIQRNKITPLEKDKIKQFLERIKILEIIDRIQRRGRERSQYSRGITKTSDWKEKKQELQQKEKNQREMLQKQQDRQKKIENKIKDINIKQEIDLNTRVTDMKNLEQVLQKNEKMPELEHGDEGVKVGIVESDDLKKLRNEKGEEEQGHSSRYETVMITKQGKVKTLDLENDTQEGTNPLEKNYQVKQKGNVRSGDVLTRLKLGEGTIGIEKGQYGEVEIYHSPRKTIGGKGVEGNKSLDRQLETSNAKNTLEGTDIESLKLAQEHNDGYRSVEKGYQEAKEHKEKHPECEPKNAKDLDGDVNTQSHPHDTEDFVELSSGEKVTYNQLATRWGFYKDGKPDAAFVKEKFAEKEQGEKTPDDVIEELDEEYEDPRAPEQTR